MYVVRFRYHGRVGHFLRAEMNASALSYPVPPRTALLGLLGNVLGLSKDESPRFLGGAAIAIRGTVPRRHYHRANVRKEFPAALPLWIKPAKAPQTQADESGSGFVSQVVQEWLLDPDFVVYVGADERFEWITELESRLREAKTHFTPCLGLAWMLAEVSWEAAGVAKPLPDGVHEVGTVCPRSDETKLILPRLAERKGYAVQEILMPRSVTIDRIFAHANYYLELQGRAIPVKTTHAWSFQGEAIVFL
jgi:CRISPR-associated protein Cas5h